MRRVVMSGNPERENRENKRKGPAGKGARLGGGRQGAFHDNRYAMQYISLAHHQVV